MPSPLKVMIHILPKSFIIPAKLIKVGPRKIGFKTLFYSLCLCCCCCIRLLLKPQVKQFPSRRGSLPLPTVSEDVAAAGSGDYFAAGNTEGDGDGDVGLNVGSISVDASVRTGKTPWIVY